MLIHICTHFPDKNSRHCLLFLEFNNDYTLRSMLVFLPCCYNTILAGNLVLINCQNMTNCVEIV